MQRLMLVHPQVPRRAEHHGAEPRSPKVCDRAPEERPMICVVEDSEPKRRGRESHGECREHGQGEARREEQGRVGQAKPGQDHRRFALQPRIANRWPPASLFGSEMHFGSRFHITPESGLRGIARHWADGFGRQARSDRIDHRRKLRRLGADDWPAIFSRKTILPLVRS